MRPKASFHWFVSAWAMLFISIGFYVINDQLHLISLLLVILIVILLVGTGLYFRIGEKR